MHMHIHIVFVTNRLRWVVTRGHATWLVEADLPEGLEQLLVQHDAAAQRIQCHIIGDSAYGLLLNDESSQSFKAGWRLAQTIKNYLNKELEEQLTRRQLPTFHLQMTERQQRQKGIQFSYGIGSSLDLIVRLRNDLSLSAVWQVCVNSQMKQMQRRIVIGDLPSSKFSGCAVSSFNNGNDYTLHANSYSDLIRGLNVQLEYLRERRSLLDIAEALDPEYHFVLLNQAQQFGLRADLNSYSL